MLKSCKFVHAFEKCGQSNVMVRLFQSTQIGSLAEGHVPLRTKKYILLIDHLTTLILHRFCE